MSKTIQIIIPQGSPDAKEARQVAERFDADVSVVRYMGSQEVMAALSHARDKYMEVRHDGSEKTWARQIKILTELSNYRAIVEKSNGVVLSVRNYGLGSEVSELEFSKKSTTTESKKSGCFISTATSEYMRKSDDCYELMVLRKFRDEFLLKNPKYAHLVSEYYEVSPLILDSEEIAKNYEYIWLNIENIVELINKGSFESAIFEYKDMIYSLAGKVKNGTNTAIRV